MEFHLKGKNSVSGLIDRARAPARAFVCHPWLKKDAASATRLPEARLEEAVSLTRAIDLSVVGRQAIPLGSVRPATYLGQGKVDELAAAIAALDAGLVVMDCPLTPGQQRNLEKAWNCKVIDRTGLILEIFGARAQTREGRLQVELAHLDYQKSRLVRSWTHLERQRGGFGFLGGPGETQIEADRRMIGDRMAKLRRELEQVSRTRSLHRKGRQKVPYPVVALVGYTNAGKSTLFNALTRADVRAENLLFATLDPTMRQLPLPGGGKAILSDTVGFVSELPTQLVAAFRATLEEVLEADLILHVRDIAHPESEAQDKDVRGVLAELGVDTHSRYLEIYNKIDLLDAEACAALRARAAREPGIVPVSAATGEGLDQLRARVAERISGDRLPMDIDLDPADGAALAWLHENAQVVDQRPGDGKLRLSVRISPAIWRKFQKRQTVRAA